MGVLNVTPDSFSDGGCWYDADRAVAHGQQLIADGADLLDVGGQSSRPGARPVPAAEEARRVIPVIERLAAQTSVPISIDTCRASVARQALDAGAQIINDISALRADPAMVDVAVAAAVPVVLMHMRGTPLTMQQQTDYGDLIDTIRRFFDARCAWAVQRGIARERMVLDPGIGFAKQPERDNQRIIDALPRLAGCGCPLLVGPSRKTFIARLTGNETDALDDGTAAAIALAVDRGAHLVRVHNVRRMRRVVAVARSIAYL